MASNITAVLKEINSAKALFRARGDGGASSNDAALQKSCADAMVIMMNAVKSFGPSEASQILDALNDKPYGAEQTERMRTWIDTKLQTRFAHVGKLASTKSKPNQF